VTVHHSGDIMQHAYYITYRHISFITCITRPVTKERTICP